MNMFKYIIVLFTVIIHINCDNSDCKGSAFKGSDCFEMNESSNEDHCCYFTGKYKQDSSLIKQCIIVEKDGFDDFDKVIDSYSQNYNEVSIDCKSYFLNYGILLNLIIILLEVFN